jgi:Rrf2 family protein
MILQHSKGGQYAIRAMVFLAGLPGDESARQSDIASATHVPHPYLSKLMALLARAGLVTARRGPWGGVRLSRPANLITLDQIIQAVDGRRPLEGCILGYAQCSADNPCSLHFEWTNIRDQIEEHIFQRTLADQVLAARKIL